MALVARGPAETDAAEVAAVDERHERAAAIERLEREGERAAP
ncbi:MAG TPA: hypothetical protein VKV23_10165 [Acidimicrobiales bacterium]|nr:hypothetical protein [Acidimicrobiales bacterium]